MKFTQELLNKAVDELNKYSPNNDFYNETYYEAKYIPKFIDVVEHKQSTSRYRCVAMGNGFYFWDGPDNICDMGITSTRMANITRVDMSTEPPTVTKCVVRWAWLPEAFNYKAIPETLTPTLFEMNLLETNSKDVPGSHEERAAPFIDALRVFAHTVKKENPIVEDQQEAEKV